MKPKIVLALSVEEIFGINPKLVKEAFDMRRKEYSTGFTVGYTAFHDGHQFEFDKNGNYLGSEYSGNTMFGSKPEEQPVLDFASIWFPYLLTQREMIAAINGIKSEDNYLALEQLVYIRAKYQNLWTQEDFDATRANNAVREKIQKLFPKFGYVYVLQSAEVSGGYKIGLTANLEQRLDHFQMARGNPNLKFSNTFPCLNMNQAEAALHKFYSSQLYNREWFLLNEKQTAALLNVSYCDYIEDMLDSLRISDEELRARAKGLLGESK